MQDCWHTSRELLSEVSTRLQLSCMLPLSTHLSRQFLPSALMGPSPRLSVHATAAPHQPSPPASWLKGLLRHQGAVWNNSAINKLAGESWGALVSLEQWQFVAMLLKKDIQSKQGYIFAAFYPHTVFVVFFSFTVFIFLPQSNWWQSSLEYANLLCASNSLGENHLLKA